MGQEKKSECIYSIFYLQSRFLTKDVRMSENSVCSGWLLKHLWSLYVMLKNEQIYNKVLNGLIGLIWSSKKQFILNINFCVLLSVRQSVIYLRGLVHYNTGWMMGVEYRCSPLHYHALVTYWIRKWLNIEQKWIYSTEYLSRKNLYIHLSWSCLSNHEYGWSLRPPGA